MLPSGPELIEGLDHVAGAPVDAGVVELIVMRPEVDERVVLEVAQLDEHQGLVGDSWLQRGSRRTADGLADPLGQLAIMSSRAAALLAGWRDRWPLAGDQLFLDLDLSEASLPAGARLAVGSAVVEITVKPHRGCAKFAARFGTDALRLANSEVGLALNLRGRNARVIQSGRVRVGDDVVRLDVARS